MGRRQIRILEIIHLRLAAHGPELMAELTREVGSAGGDIALQVYRHSRVGTDLLIHLHRDVPEGADSPSDLGARLASLLREHGIVEHSVWVEQSGGGGRPGLDRDAGRRS